MDILSLAGLIIIVIIVFVVARFILRVTSWILYLVLLGIVACGLLFVFRVFVF